MDLRLDNVKNYRTDIGGLRRLGRTHANTQVDVKFGTNTLSVLINSLNFYVLGFKSAQNHWYYFTFGQTTYGLREPLRHLQLSENYNDMGYTGSRFISVKPEDVVTGLLGYIPARAAGIANGADRGKYPADDVMKSQLVSLIFLISEAVRFDIVLEAMCVCVNKRSTTDLNVFHSTVTNWESRRAFGVTSVYHHG